MGVRRTSMSDYEEEKKSTAIHEIGHALVAMLTPNALPVYKVTILPSGQALGHVNQIFFFIFRHLKFPKKIF